MPTKEELAIMSALAYGVGAPPNNLVDPSGWSSSPGPRSEYGLQYRVFVRGAEIVIAYAGTNEPDDLIADLDGALGVPDLQFFAAAQVYAEVRRDHPEIPPENITFTGHSLGGGIASVMAVWFDRQATVFAPAPFQSYVMDGPAQALSVLAQLYLLKNVGPYWGLVSYFAEAQLPAREANVTSYAVVGEFLETPPFTSLNTIEGPDAYHLDIGNEPASRWTRHLMDLHAAATIDATFVHALHELPAAGAAIFDETLYKKKLKSGERDFLRMLLQRRGNGALHNFALDLERLTGTGGVQLLSGGLVAALMDRYMDAPPGPVAQVIDAVSGGVHLVSPVSSYPGRVRLNAAMAGLLFGDDRTAAEGTIVLRVVSLLAHRREVPQPVAGGVLGLVRKLSMVGLAVALIAGMLVVGQFIVGLAGRGGGGFLSYAVFPMLLGLPLLAALEATRLLGFERHERRTANPA